MTRVLFQATTVILVLLLCLMAGMRALVCIREGPPDPPPRNWSWADYPGATVIYRKEAGRILSAGDRFAFGGQGMHEYDAEKLIRLKSLIDPPGDDEWNWRFQTTGDELNSVLKFYRKEDMELEEMIPNSWYRYRFVREQYSTVRLPEYEELNIVRVAKGCLINFRYLGDPGIPKSAR